MDTIQKDLKTIANATSYGIFIELNPEDKESEVDVYGLEHFQSKVKSERMGKMFNPIIATMLTSYARLILATVESISKEGFAYCDTDSIFVLPDRVKEIQEFFRPLNPYSTDTEMFKIENNDDGNALDNVLFYGISAKRYCLYRIENAEIKILKYSTHRLGHLLKIDGEQIWKDILNKNFENYSDKIAVSQITITKPSILDRFKTFNKNKPLDRQIKPFSFMLIGSDVNGTIPSLPYTKDINGIQYRKFVDYRTGLPSDNLPLPTTAYWKYLQDVLIRYIRHNDHKFDYIEGIAKRKHIIVDRIRYIGKESNNLDEVSVFGIDEYTYLEYGNPEAFKQWILTVKPKDVRDEGISRKVLLDVKNKIKSHRPVNLRTKIPKILIGIYKSAKSNA